MPGSWQSYTEAERAAAVGRALAIGTKKAAAVLDIPRRTLSSWLQRPTAAVQAAIASTRTDVAASFWAVVDAGTKAMLAKIGDPKTRAGELAAIVKTAVESHALLTGGATSRTASVNVNVVVPARPGRCAGPRRRVGCCGASRPSARSRSPSGWWSPPGSGR